MTIDEFWDHIRATWRKDPETHAERLTNRLAKLPPDQILDFVRHWDTASNRAYEWNLWGAAYLINGGCSDDGFQYFRWWLILQGRAVYEAAVANPDTLAAVVDGEDEIEAEVGPGMDAWFAATGTRTDDDGYRRYADALGPRLRVPELRTDWDHDDDAEVRRRLPRLAALYQDDE